MATLSAVDEANGMAGGTQVQTAVSLASFAADTRRGTLGRLTQDGTVKAALISAVLSILRETPILTWHPADPSNPEYCSTASPLPGSLRTCSDRNKNLSYPRRWRYQYSTYL